MYYGEIRETKIRPKIILINKFSSNQQIMKSTHTHNVTNHYIGQLIKLWHCCVLPYRMALEFNAMKLQISNLNGNKDCIRWIVINTINIRSCSRNIDMITSVVVCLINFWVRSQNYEKRPLASSCLPVRKEQLGSSWTDFHDIWYWSI
jgi:hypothetical protein